MARHARSPSFEDRIVPGAGFTGTQLDTLLTRSPADFQRAAAAEVDLLIDQLEPTLDERQRRLLHQLRLAAETLGAVRASTGHQLSRPL
jgi:hypothetical protein